MRERDRKWRELLKLHRISVEILGRQNRELEAFSKNRAQNLHHVHSSIPDYLYFLSSSTFLSIKVVISVFIVLTLKFLFVIDCKFIFSVYEFFPGFVVQILNLLLVFNP